MQQTHNTASPAGLRTPAEIDRATTMLAYGAALAIGLLLTFYVFPLDYLSSLVDLTGPADEDMAQNAIVQRYFFADGWRWPPLIAANLAGPEGTNIGLIDGIPLLALPLKLLAPWLPDVFHGANLWYAIAWLLQPLAAVWCLRSAGERRLLPAVAIAVAAVSMPVWWNRYGHASLCSHFLILMALGCYLRLAARPSVRLWSGAVLLVLAALLTQPYLAMMVLAVLGAVPLTLMFRGDGRWIGAAFGCVVVMVTLFAGMWALGYLGVTGGYGFGEFKMDALSPIWPHRSALLPWPVPELGPWEGFNYLGAGLLLGLVMALLLCPAAIRGMILRHAGLALAMVGLALFSLSQRPTVGGHLVLDLGIVPDWLQNLRSTGRFFWPVAYTLLVATILLVARYPRPRTAALLLTAIGALQFADVANLREGLRERLLQPRPAWAVDATGLRALLADTKSVTLLPTWYCVPVPDYEPEQDLLLQTLQIASETAVPASTMDVPRYHGELRCDDERLASAPFGRGELRVLTPAAQAAYLKLVPRAGELCAPMGRVVACHDPDSTGRPPTEPSPPPALAAGETRFAAGRPSVAMLGEGWSKPEGEGVWSEAPTAVLRAVRPADLAGPLRVRFFAQGFAPSAAEPQRVELWLGERMLERWVLRHDQFSWLEAELPQAEPGPMRLEFRIAAPASPVERGIGDDPRKLGIRLVALEVMEPPAWPSLRAERTEFAPEAPGATFLGYGWSDPEPAGVWSDGGRAELLAWRPAELQDPLELDFKLMGFAPRADAAQPVELWLDGKKLARWDLPDREITRVTAVLPAGPPGLLQLQFRIDQPTRPVDRSMNADTRLLGFQIQAMRVKPAGWWEQLRAKLPGY